MLVYIKSMFGFMLQLYVMSKVKPKPIPCMYSQTSPIKLILLPKARNEKKSHIFLFLVLALILKNTTFLKAACLVTFTATSSWVALVNTRNSWFRVVGRNLIITWLSMAWRLWKHNSKQTHSSIIHLVSSVTRRIYGKLDFPLARQRAQRADKVWRMWKLI